MQQKNALIVFVKNPVKGKVKTRLAQSIGEDNAFKVYHHLLKHTLSVSRYLDCDKYVFYSDYIDVEDSWGRYNYFQQLQSGSDLGERMKNAFLFVFGKAYKNVIIIGSDCIELTSGHLENAFSLLNKHTAVIGPARDGGYYLLGLNNFYQLLFENKHWSTNIILTETINDFKTVGISYALLEELSDIDEAEDLRRFAHKFNFLPDI